MKYSIALAGTIATILHINAIYAADSYKPYILANPSTLKAEDVKKNLTAQGFEIAGSYKPYAGAEVIVATNDALKQAAAASKFGGYGAMVRIAITETNGQSQASYTNASYMGNMYHIKGNLSGVEKSVESALGKDKSFGAATGMSADELHGYHYMIGMPYFDDQVELAAYDSYKTAVSKVESGLNNGKTTKKIYRIDIPGKEETVIGVAILEGDGADKAIMGAIDKGALKQTAHLPYEVLISGKKAYILAGKFRIAQSFPDLSMGDFMTISSAPDAIESTIKAAINN